MGLMQFLVPHRDRLPPRAESWAYLAGIDGVAWRSENRATDDGLELEREEDDSGTLSIPWRVDGHGVVTLATGSLMQRDRPYHLTVELARGTLNRIRNQIAEWVAIGLLVPEEVSARLLEAQSLLAQAVTGQEEVAAAGVTADMVIALGCEVIEGLAEAYSAQALARRHRQMPKLATLFGAALGQTDLDASTDPDWGEAFNTAMIDLSWKQIERRDGHCDFDRTDRQITWARNRKMKICGGPLLRFDDAGMPDWLYLWEGEYDQIIRSVERYVEQVVKQYVGKVNLWMCGGRINTGRALALTDEQRLRLTVRAIEVTRSIDERAPVVVGFDQPWGEYMSREAHDLSGLHFADALVRAQLGVAGIALEMNLGYHPGGTLPRHALDLNRQIDHWTQLGLPLVLVITVPSGYSEDRSAQGPAEVVTDTRLNAASQQAWIDSMVPMLMAKQAVQGIIWNQLHDDQPHEFPHAGLIDAQGNAKPAVASLIKLRETHLS